MKAHEIAERAASLVSGERNHVHGEAGQNHKNIAAFWNAYLAARFIAHNKPPILQAQDVAVMMVMLKAARTTFGAHNLDDYVDMVGYASIAGDLAERDAAMATRIVKEHPPENPALAAASDQLAAMGGAPRPSYGFEWTKENLDAAARALSANGKHF